MLHGRIFNGDLEININDVNNHIPLSNHVDSTRHQLVRAECVRCPWLQAELKVATILGNYSTLLLPPLFKTPEGVVVGFQIFAWAPK